MPMLMQLDQSLHRPDLHLRLLWLISIILLLSTDGTATDAGGLSLDAIAKDKRVLQERLKKILAFNIYTRSVGEGSLQVREKEAALSSMRGILTTPVPPRAAFILLSDIAIQPKPFKAQWGECSTNEQLQHTQDKLLRPKRMTLYFVEESKCSTDAEMIEMKYQFGEANTKELKANQAQMTKTKAEPDINPNIIEVGERLITKEEPEESIPDIEWWDVPFLQSGTYCDIDDDKMKMDEIAIYIKHPQPIEPLSEPASPPPQPLKLTKQEQKKLRTQL